jgi:tetratricopeptide (TPR) repeat protein
MVASLFYLGESYRLRELYELALDYFCQATNLCDENEEFPAVALIFSKIGYIKYKQNNIDEAQFYFLKSLKAYEKSIFAWGRAEVYYYLFKIYETKKCNVKARNYLEEAIKYVNKYSSKELRENIYDILNKLN